MIPIRRVLLAMFVAISPTDGFAQNAPFPTYPEKLTGICNDVYARVEDNSNPDEYSYAYERKIYQAAGVDFKIDTSSSARAKIQYLWNHNQNRLRCSSTNFSQTNGGILKYAIEMRTFGMIDNAMKVWRVNLNMIDSDFKNTLLDYVRDKMNASRGTENEITITGYYNMLRRYGAKHCTELASASECRK